VAMTDLDLVPTEALLKTLKRRFDHMVFASRKDMGGDQDSARSAISSSPGFAGF